MRMQSFIATINAYFCQIDLSQISEIALKKDYIAKIRHMNLKRKGGESLCVAILPINIHILMITMEKCTSMSTCMTRSIISIRMNAATAIRI